MIARVMRWRWMDGRTLRRDDGTYLARIYADGGDPKRSPHPAAVLVARQWEIEGYGATPAEAEADLIARWHPKR